MCACTLRMDRGAMPNCLLVAAGLPLMRREELDAATVVLVVGGVLVVGSTCSASGSYVLVLLLDEAPPMPIAGDMPRPSPMPSSLERELVPKGAVLEYVRLALAFALIARNPTRIDEDEDVAEETEAPSLLLLAWWLSTLFSILNVK